MEEMMTFPDTWEEFEEQYGITDREEIYTNGARLIPSFRVKQWLDHIADRPQGEWKSVKASIYPYGYDVECSVCGHRMGSSFGYKFCPMCGARMRPKLQGTHFDSIIIDECAMKGADDE